MVRAKQSVVHKKNKSQFKIYFFILLALLGLFTLIVRPFLVTAAPLTPKQQLERAWRFAADVGAYQYHADATQTTHPTARLENTGRHPQSERIQVEGALDLHNETMSLRLWNQSTSDDGLELKVEAGRAYGRLTAQEEWTEIDNPTDLFAPGGDPLGFLAAADNIEQIDNVGEEALSSAAYTRYRFDINGPRYAEHIQGQMQKEMSRKGELPPGMTVDVSHLYAKMTGWGEIWLDEAGLPARQVIHLEFPPQEDALDWHEANITTSFSNWDTNGVENQLLWAIPRLMDDPSLVTQNPMSLLPTSFDPNAIQQMATLLGFSLVLFGLGFLAFTYRRSPKFHGAIAISVIASMLFSPLLQINQVDAYYDRHETTQPEQSQEPQLSQSAEPVNETFDPTIDPLVSQPEKQFNLKAAAPTQQVNTNCDSQVDTDGDGLSDSVECTQLGTYVDDVDSDGDGISDKTEVAGFSLGGQIWYLDPLNFDSNGDGISDLIECPALVDVAEDGSLTTPSGTSCRDTDSDGVPNVFDFDNDGDGVPDNVDSAPTYRGDLTRFAHDSFDLSLNDYDTTNAGALVVEFELRPQVYEHLFQSNNVFDWPSNDTKGQITRIEGTTFANQDNANFGSRAHHGDVVVIPMLEITLPAPLTNTANPSSGLPVKADFNGSINNSNLKQWLDADILKEYDISVRQASNGEMFVYTPLVQILDPVGNTPVAWGGQMLYRPQNGSWGQAHEVRQVWLVEAIIDRCDTDDMANTFTYIDEDGKTHTVAKSDADAYKRWCDNHANWDTQTQIIHTYYENFHLTGMVVREDYEFETAVIAQNNALSQPYENYLWYLASNLTETFGEGERLSDNSRFDIEEVVNRFSPSSPATWGIPQGTFSMETAVGSNSYNNQVTAMRALADTHIPDLLTNTYSSATNGATTTLLIAREETFKTTTLDNQDTIDDDTNDTLSVNLSSTSLRTFASLNWAPYQYQTSASQPWTSMDIYDHQNALEGKLENAINGSDVAELLSWFGENSQNTPTEKAAVIGLARNFYTTMYIGSSTAVEDSQSGILNDAVIDETEYDLDYDNDGQADEAVLYLVAVALDYMRSFFVAEGDILMDETSEVMFYIGKIERILDAEEEENPIIVTARGGTSAGQSSFKKLFKKLTEAKGSTKWKYRSGTKHAATGMAIMAGVLVSGYLPVEGKDEAMAYAAASLTVATESLNVFISMKDYHYAKNTWAATEAAANMKTLSRAVKVGAVIGFIANAGIASMAFYMAIQSAEPGSQAFNYAIAQYVAAMIVAIVYAIISATVIGAIIIGIIGLIDVVIAAACLVVEKGAGVEIDDEVQSWVCGGITGAITKALSYGIYDTATILDPADADRLTIALDRPTLINPNAGYIVGNSVTLGATITNSIKVRNNLTAFGYTDLHALFTFFTEDTLHDSTFAYTLQTQQIDRHKSLSQGTLDWTNNTEVFSPAQTFTLSQAGINKSVNDNLYLTEAFNIPSLECWGFILQKCVEKSYKDSFHYDWTNIYTFDILPIPLTVL